jgi:hypothetical protein
MKISNEQLMLFEQEWMMEHLKNPTYRYGQAFFNQFRDLHDRLMAEDSTRAECMRLWEERDAGMAKRHIMKWVK